MPVYTANETWTAGITVAAGDIVQNVGDVDVLVCPQDPPNDDDAAELPPNRGVTITAATQIGIRSSGAWNGLVKIIRGL